MKRNHTALSTRELEVVRELCKGKSNKEIALSLGISVNTVKTHLSRSLRKAKVSNRAELIIKNIKTEL